MILRAAVDEEGCEWWDAGCHVGEIASSEFANFVRDIWKLLIDFLGWINSFWVGIPSADVTAPSIGQINGWMGWYTAAIAVIGLLLGLGRMAISNDFKAGLPSIKMLVNLILVTGVYAVAFAGLMTAGDKFAPWIIQKATGEELSLSGMLSLSEMMLIYPGGGLFLAIIGLLGALVNVRAVARCCGWQRDRDGFERVPAVAGLASGGDSVQAGGGDHLRLRDDADEESARHRWAR